MRRDPFQAIADPTRRQIISYLADEPMTLNSLAGKFCISRPAISRHVKILEESGVVRIEQSGRERRCHVQFEQLREVSDWIQAYEKFWNNRLDLLGDYLTNTKPKTLSAKS